MPFRREAPRNLMKTRKAMDCDEGVYVSYRPRSNSSVTQSPSGLRKLQQKWYEVFGLARALICLGYFFIYLTSTPALNRLVCRGLLLPQLLVHFYQSVHAEPLLN